MSRELHPLQRISLPVNHIRGLVVGERWIGFCRKIDGAQIAIDFESSNCILIRAQKEKLECKNLDQLARALRHLLAGEHLNKFGK